MQVVEIRVPPNFRNAAGLPAIVDGIDPRTLAAGTEAVTIDLSGCYFIRAPGLMWCVIMSLLVRHASVECRVELPNQRGVLHYLQRAGFFDMLRSAEVAFEDPMIDDSTPTQLVMAPTLIETERDAESLVENAFDALEERGVGPGDMYWTVSDVFGELCLNAVQHSESSIGSYAMIQFYQFEEKDQFSLVIADGGIGIRESLGRNPQLHDAIGSDRQAVELAVQERVSSSAESTRGIGLHTVTREMSIGDRTLLIHSGTGSLELDEHSRQIVTRDNRLFPGTLAYARLAVPE